MDLSKFYSQVYDDIEPYLEDNGFSIVENDSSGCEDIPKDGNLWEGSIDIKGEGLVIYLFIPYFFPDKLPKVYLKKSPQNPIPHLDSKKFVCTFRESGLRYRAENYTILIDEVLKQAKKIISDGIEGINIDDFEEEFLDYWRQKSNVTFVSILSPSTQDGKVVVASVEFTSGVKYYVVGNEYDYIEQFYLKIDPNCKIEFISFGWFSRLKYVPTPPFPSNQFEYYKLLQLDKRQQKKLKKLTPKGFHAPKFVFFSIKGNDFILAAWGAVFNSRKHFIRSYNVVRYDSDRIYGRIGKDNMELKTKKVCIIGCGSIGSRVAIGLIEAGIEQLLIIDPEKLEMDNIARHLCGANSVGLYKVESVKKQVEQHFPASTIDAINKDVLEVLSEDTKDEILKCDLIISATGERTIERRLNIIASSEENFPPIIYTFTEAFGIASHAMYVNISLGGCYECALGEKLDFKYVMADTGDRSIEQQDRGCQATFLPYSSEDTKMAASIAIRLSEQALTTNPTKTIHMLWAGNLEEIDRHGLKRNPLYHECRSFSIYEYYRPKDNNCSVCKHD